MCRGIFPKVTKLATELDGKMKFAKINMGEIPGAGTLYSDLSIKNLPTFHAYKKVRGAMRIVCLCRYSIHALRLLHKSKRFLIISFCSPPICGLIYTGRKGG